MIALGNLIMKVLKKQFTLAKTIDEYTAILDRTVQFAETTNSNHEPYITDDQIAEIASIVSEAIIEPAAEVADTQEAEGEIPEA